jgi:hypothetical protein
MAIVMLATTCLVVAGGCTSSPSPHPSPSTASASLGVITGLTSLCYGPAAPRPGAKAMVSVADSRGTEVARQEVGKPYTFSFAVKPGEYIVSGPGARSASVAVDAGQTVKVKLLVLCL